MNKNYDDNHQFLSLPFGSIVNVDEKEAFHNRHESHTELAYNTPNILPDRYVFIVTNLCNLKCSFCFQKKTPSRDSMSLNDWIDLTMQLPEYARVTLTGGEPFAFPGFEALFARVAEKHDCNIITNGLLLTTNLVDLLLSYSRFKVLSISVDNIGNTLRNVKPEQWTKTESMLAYFRAIRNSGKLTCVLEAKTMILDENAEDLLAIHKYCMEKLHCDHHSFQFLKGSPIQHADFMSDFKDILEKSSAFVYRRFQTIVEQLELIRQYNVETDAIGFLHPKIASLTSNEIIQNLEFINKSDFLIDNFLPCKFPWSSVHINSDGHLFPCLAISMGNVKKRKLTEVIWSEDYSRFKDVIREKGAVEACNRCGWLRPVVTPN